jgi:AraC family transcriptional regulator
MGGIVCVFQGGLGRVTLFETDVSVVRHVHPQVHVLIKLGGADSDYEVGERVCRLTDDQMVLVNSWTPHANWRMADDPGTTMIALYVEPGWLRAAIDRPVAIGGHFAMPVAPVTPRIRACAQDIADAIAAATELDEDTLDDPVREILADILDRFEGVAQPRPRLRSSDYRIRRAMSLMAAQTGPRGMIKHLPRSVGLSRSRFYEQFKDTAGISPGVYADGVTLDHAIRQLVATSNPIGEISADLGFAAQGHFTRYFKSKVCFTPSEYRRVAMCMGGSAAGPASATPPRRAYSAPSPA